MLPLTVPPSGTRVCSNGSLHCRRLELSSDDALDKRPPTCDTDSTVIVYSLDYCSILFTSLLYEALLICDYSMEMFVMPLNTAVAQNANLSRNSFPSQDYPLIFL